LFNKPKAAVIIVVDSVGADILNKYPALSLLQDAHATTLTTQSALSNAHALLASLATGATPSEHGIVGATWHSASSYGALVTAYDENGLPLVANIADILLQESHGVSLVVSASASPIFASALAAHPHLVEENLGWRAHAYSFSTESGFASRYADPSCDPLLALSPAELAVLLADVSVAVGDVEVTFTTKTKVDLDLLAELAFVNNLIAKLRDHSELSKLVKDDIPDLYSFVFSSLKGIQEYYGLQSAAFSAALSLVDAATHSLTCTLDRLYDGRVATAVVALNARDASSQALKEKVYNKVARLLHSQEDFELHYPSVYVRPNELYGHARDIMCANLQAAVSKDANVHCLAPLLPTRYGKRVENDTDDSSSETPTELADTATIWAFWLNFWVTLIITAFVGWGVYCLTYVGSDASKDSLLFRATGRHSHQN
jgi:hypothetical protein